MGTLARRGVVACCLLAVLAGCGGGHGTSSTGGMGGLAGFGGTAGIGGAAGSGGVPGGTGGDSAGGAGGTGGTLSCAGTDFGTDIDIPSVPVTGTFKINGATVTSADDAGAILLRAAGGDEIALGATSAGSYAVRVIPGTYDLVYQRTTSGPTAPRNGSATLRSVTITAPGPTVLDVDVPSVVVTGKLRINGNTITSTNDSGTLTLRDARGKEAILGNTSAGSYSVRVIPGTYDVVYHTGSSTSVMAPLDTGAKLRSVVVAATGTTTLDIDVPSVVLSGTFKVNGAAVTSTGDSGYLILYSKPRGDTVMLATTAAGSYSVHLVPGSYDVIYASTASNTIAPANTMVTVGSVTVALTGTTVLDVDVPSATLTGSFLINGAPVSAINTNDYGTVELRSAVSDDRVVLGQGFTPSYSVHVVPGSYDVIYRWSSAASANAARNNFAKVRSVTVAATGTTTMDVDIPAVPLSGTLTINGSVLSDPNDEGIVMLRNDAGDWVNLGLTSAGSYAVRAVPGTYDAYYEVFNANGAIAPRNQYAKIRSGVVVGTGPTTLDFDVSSVPVTGAISINGAPATSMTDFGTLMLRRNGSDTITLGKTYAGSYTASVVPGTYTVEYMVGTPGPVAPRNTRGQLRCLTVP